MKKRFYFLAALDLVGFFISRLSRPDSLNSFSYLFMKGISFSMRYSSDIDSTFSSPYFATSSRLEN